MKAITFIALAFVVFAQSQLIPPTIPTRPANVKITVEGHPTYNTTTVTEEMWIPEFAFAQIAAKVNKENNGTLSVSKHRLLAIHLFEKSVNYTFEIKATVSSWKTYYLANVTISVDPFNNYNASDVNSRGVAHTILPGTPKVVLPFFVNWDEALVQPSILARLTDNAAISVLQLEAEEKSVAHIAKKHGEKLSVHSSVIYQIEASATKFSYKFYVDVSGGQVYDTIVVIDVDLATGKRTSNVSGWN